MFRFTLVEMVLLVVCAAACTQTQALIQVPTARVVPDPEAEERIGLEERIKQTSLRLRREAALRLQLAEERAQRGWLRPEDVPVRINGELVLLHPAEATTLYALQEELAVLLRRSGRAWCASGAERYDFHAFPDIGDLDPNLGVQCWRAEEQEWIPLRPVITAARGAMYQRYPRPVRVSGP